MPMAGLPVKGGGGGEELEGLEEEEEEEEGQVPSVAEHSWSSSDFDEGLIVWLGLLLDVDVGGGGVGDSGGRAVDTDWAAYRFDATWNEL